MNSFGEGDKQNLPITTQTAKTKIEIVEGCKTAGQHHELLTQIVHNGLLPIDDKTLVTNVGLQDDNERGDNRPTVTALDVARNIIRDWD